MRRLFMNSFIRSDLMKSWQTIAGLLREQRELKPRGSWIAKLQRRCWFRLETIDVLRYVGIHRPPINCLFALRSLTALLPLNRSLQDEVLQIIKSLNVDDVRALRSYLAEADGPVVIITGCMQRYFELQKCLNAFHEADPSLKVIGVIGQPSLPDWSFRFDLNRQCLFLPVSDQYQALPHKVAWTCLVMSLFDSVPAVLKIDDDAIPGDLSLLRLLFSKLANTDFSAAGYPILTNSHLSLDRGWHIGKSSASANLTVFDGPSTRLWMSGGTGYLLCKDGIMTIAAHALHSWGIIKMMFYEDMASSLILKLAGCSVYWLKNPEDLGVSTERATEIRDGAWSVDWEQLSHLS